METIKALYLAGFYDYLKGPLFKSDIEILVGDFYTNHVR